MIKKIQYFTTRIATSMIVATLLTSCGSNLKAHGTIVDQPAPEMKLTTAANAPFLMSEQHDKEVVVFFGYTHCGDVCPTTLAHVSQAMSHIGKLRTPIETVFVSVDPKRDTPTIVARYAKQFNPSFIGVTGSTAQLAQVQRDFHVWSKAMPADKNGNYEVSHSSQLFLIAPSGRLRIIEDWDASIADLTDDLKALQ